jgi:hypothetical protein
MVAEAVSAVVPPPLAGVAVMVTATDAVSAAVEVRVTTFGDPPVKKVPIPHAARGELGIARLQDGQGVAEHRAGEI